MSKRRQFSVSEVDAILERSKLTEKSFAFVESAGRAAARAFDISSPLTNRGGSGQDQALQVVKADLPERVVLTDGGARVELARKGNAGQACFIDYASMTFGEGIVRSLGDNRTPFTDQEHADVIGCYARDALLGVKCEVNDMRSGIFGYLAASKIGDYGIAAAGGNGTSCYLSFTGLAFAVADEGFPERLHRFLLAVGSAQLTRIDIAFDDVEGKYFPVRNIPARYQAGEFSSPRSPKLPNFEQRGQWLSNDPEGRGLTAYIGSRSSGKLLRIYEKGKQLGDTSSAWVRAEAELRNSVFALVPAMLVNPSGFFVMLCAGFASVAYAGKPERLMRQAAEAVTGLDAILDTIKTQYGGYLDVLRKERYFDSDSELLDRVCRVPRVVPVALRKVNVLSGAALSVGAGSPSSSAEIL